MMAARTMIKTVFIIFILIPATHAVTCAEVQYVFDAKWGYPGSDEGQKELLLQCLEKISTGAGENLREDIKKLIKELTRDSFL